MRPSEHPNTAVDQLLRASGPRVRAAVASSADDGHVIRFERRLTARHRARRRAVALVACVVTVMGSVVGLRVVGGPGVAVDQPSGQEMASVSTDPTEPAPLDGSIASPAEPTAPTTAAPAGSTGGAAPVEPDVPMETAPPPAGSGSGVDAGAGSSSLGGGSGTQGGSWVSPTTIPTTPTGTPLGTTPVPGHATIEVRARLGAIPRGGVTIDATNAGAGLAPVVTEPDGTAVFDGVAGGWALTASLVVTAPNPTDPAQTCATTYRAQRSLAAAAGTTRVTLDLFAAEQTCADPAPTP